MIRTFWLVSRKYKDLIIDYKQVLCNLQKLGKPIKLSRSKSAPEPENSISIESIKPPSVLLPVPLKRMPSAP
jgi:hypothetical protein